ncbi:hypothetical protein F5X99DRAFT_324810 [Biscogniauxia marginata]|nr:hypothetical protein F5X99DRAFT_324810 [Biscogniauxia marginata]
MADVFSTTTINGKKCTAVPRANNAIGGQPATSTPETSSSIPVSSSSTSPSTSTSTSSSSLSSSSSSSSSLTSTPIPIATSASAPLTDDAALLPTPPPPVANPALSEATSSVTQETTTSASTQTSDGTEAGATATTTMGDGSQLESQTTGVGLPGPSQKAATGNAISNETTVAVAGGVIGGLAVVSLIGFLIWYWRKRQRKSRRSTLLTPLSAEPPFRGKEKDERQYIISRTSLGPTPFPMKLRAMASYNYQRLRGRVNELVDRGPNPNVNLNRGNSQFGPLDSPESRSSSRNENINDEPPAAKGRFVDWWGRLTEDTGRGWRLQGEPKSNRNDNDPFAVTRSMNEGKPGQVGSQSDFLTLLSRDNEQTIQEGGSGGDDPSSSRQHSISVGNEHFLGGLGLSLDIGDPFSDANAISRNSAKPAPLAVSGANNPFLDVNAITVPAAGAPTGPTTYVQNIRHSRGHSVSAPGAAGNRIGPPPPRVSITSNPRSSNGSVTYYNHYDSRESGASVESFETRRNKFRSDPFDLDRPELLRVGPAGTAVVSRNVSGASKRSRRGSRGYVVAPVETPRRAHVRAESYSSMYSSGVSSIGDDWSDPGPDVGPGTGAGRWSDVEGESGRGNDGDSTAVAVSRTRSGESQGSVGKAL